MNRKKKQKRSPNSAISGAVTFGNTSRPMSQPSPSPRIRATSI